MRKQTINFFANLITVERNFDIVYYYTILVTVNNFWRLLFILFIIVLHVANYFLIYIYNFIFLLFVILCKRLKTVLSGNFILCTSNISEHFTVMKHILP